MVSLINPESISPNVVSRDDRAMPALLMCGVDGAGICRRRYRFSRDEIRRGVSYRAGVMMAFSACRQLRLLIAFCEVFRAHLPISVRFCHAAHQPRPMGSSTTITATVTSAYAALAAAQPIQARLVVLSLSDGYRENTSCIRALHQSETPHMRCVSYAPNPEAFM